MACRANAHAKVSSAAIACMHDCAYIPYTTKPRAKRGCQRIQRSLASREQSMPTPAELRVRTLASLAVLGRATVHAHDGSERRVEPTSAACPSPCSSRHFRATALRPCASNRPAEWLHVKRNFPIEVCATGLCLERLLRTHLRHVAPGLARFLDLDGLGCGQAGNNAGSLLRSDSPAGERRGGQAGLAPRGAHLGCKHACSIQARGNAAHPDSYNWLGRNSLAARDGSRWVRGLQAREPGHPVMAQCM